MKKSLITIAVNAAIVGTVLSNIAYAQDNKNNESSIERKKVTQQAPTKQQKKADDIEKITVTGSRLRRDSFSVATPLVTLGRDGIDDTGLGSLSEILVDELPQVNASSSNTNSQSSVQNTGLSTINLRNLGTNRTLTLIDGRRVVSNSYSGNYVNLSTIPSGMVKRVEVITGGASAAYGSDAVAGVVNIITQQDKEGFKFKARGGKSSEGGAKEYTLDINYGSEFDDGRGYMYLSGTVDRQFGLTSYDRDRAKISDSYRYSSTQMCNQMLTVDGYQCMRDITQNDWVNLSDGRLGGVFGEYSKNDTQFWYDGQTLHNDWKDNEERYGVDFNQWTALKVPDRAIALASKFEYEISDDIQSYFQIQYSENKSLNKGAPEDEYESSYALTIDPETGAPGRIRPGYISINNPYVPAEIKDAGFYKNRIYWDRRFGEVGRVTTDNKRTTLRAWAGIQGTVFDGDWDWDVSVSHGKFKQQQNRLNELNIPKVVNALDAEYAADGVTIQCSDETARLDGCAPLNLFGAGSITPEAANYIRSNPTITTNLSQTTVTGYIAGDLFDLPAGPVASAFGVEYRRDTQDVATSKEQRYGGITFNVVPTFDGDVSVSEVFGEVALPILKDVTGAKSLTLEASLRIADYSWAGTGLVKSYKSGITWEPMTGYMVRANWARAQRAPTITELISPPRGDYDRFDDICDGVTATSTDAGHDKCRLEPSIAQVIASDGEFEDGNNSYSPNTGNKDLFEESADTKTIGLTIAPEFFEGFRLAVDYYDIKVADAIAQIDNEDIINQCYNSSQAWGDTNSFCNDITRDAEGNIIEILQRSFNLNELRTRGYDVSATYKLDLDDYGRLYFKTDMTHVIEYSKTFDTPDGPQTNDYTGDLSQGIFDDKASASLTWSKDNLRIRWSTKFKSAIAANKKRLTDWQEDIDKNTERCTSNEESCVDNPESLALYDIGSYVKHSVSVSYTSELDNAKIRYFGGINNLTDNRGDFILGGRGNFSSQYGGGVGRFFYAGAELSF